MRNSPLITPADLSQIQTQADVLWTEAREFFAHHGSVVFFSRSRFWEKHGFVQQSLAYALAGAGIPVTWLDGVGWRSYRPQIHRKSETLRVKQLSTLPLRRLPWVEKLATQIEWRQIRASLAKGRAGKRPLFWVQDGMHPELVRSLPYIDVFSVFDDPYLNSENRALCDKARVIVVQNEHALKILSRDYPDKTFKLGPPVELGEQTFENGPPLPLPERFPKRVMGYIGSFYSGGFDLIQFENFVRSLPEWGFLLMGRTDAEGMSVVQRLSKFPNFHYEPWATRSQVAAAWKCLEVSLLLYRPCLNQDGAFPVKVLESLYFGVPCVGTKVPKTRDLDGMFPLSPFPDQLKKMAVEAANLALQDPATLRANYLQLAARMNPTNYLVQIAQWLRTRV